MRCPFCGANDDKVIDSRASDGGRAIRRRRHCNTCAKRFTTREAIDDQVRLTVIKRDGSRMPYDRQKVLAGVEAACYKRPVPAEALVQLADEVEELLGRQGEREVPSADIGRAVAEKLKRLDPVAYLRFASVYLQFKDVDDIIAEAVEVKASTPPPPRPDQGELF